MEFRKAVKSDVENIMNIIRQAQSYFKENNINQWQNNYPNTEVIERDINNGYTYILLKESEIVATAAVSFNNEPTYDEIYNGEWVSNCEYAVVHRIAVHNEYKGAGFFSTIIKNVEKICLDKNIHSIKIDTHIDNKSMQKALKKNNFKYCGIIYLADKSERVAFEKIVN